MSGIEWGLQLALLVIHHLTCRVIKQNNHPPLILTTPLEHAEPTTASRLVLTRPPSWRVRSSLDLQRVHIVVPEVRIEEVREVCHRDSDVVDKSNLTRTSPPNQLITSRKPRVEVGHHIEGRQRDGSTDIADRFSDRAARGEHACVAVLLRSTLLARSLGQHRNAAQDVVDIAEPDLGNRFILVEERRRETIVVPDPRIDRMRNRGEQSNHELVLNRNLHRAVEGLTLRAGSSQALNLLEVWGWHVHVRAVAFKRLDPRIQVALNLGAFDFRRKPDRQEPGDVRENHIDIQRLLHIQSAIGRVRKADLREHIK